MTRQPPRSTLFPYTTLSRSRRDAGERTAGTAVQARRVTPRGVVARRARQVRLLATDVDGVLTDGRMVLSERGGELKSFNSRDRSEEHTSELQSQSNLVCRLL